MILDVAKRASALTSVGPAKPYRRTRGHVE